MALLVVPVGMPLPRNAHHSSHMALWCHLVDTIVETVSHNDVAVPVHCDSKAPLYMSCDPVNTPSSGNVNALLSSARQSASTWEC
jgi:hypothetical protein